MLLERKTFSRQEPLNLLLVNLNGTLIRFESTSPTSLQYVLNDSALQQRDGLQAPDPWRHLWGICLSLVNALHTLTSWDQDDGGVLATNTVGLWTVGSETLLDETSTFLTQDQCCANLRFQPNLSGRCGREVFTRSRQFKCPLCHRGISPSGYIQFPHQSRGFPFPDSFCAQGTERKSTAFIIPPHQKTTFQSSRKIGKRAEAKLNPDRLLRVALRCVPPPHLKIVHSHEAKVHNKMVKAVSSAGQWTPAEAVSKTAWNDCSPNQELHAASRSKYWSISTTAAVIA